MKEYTEEQWHQQFSNYLMEKLEMPDDAPDIRIFCVKGVKAFEQ